MKYTAAELVKYVFESELETDLFTAIMNNKMGYKILPVKGKAIREGKPRFEFEDLGLGLEPYEFSEDELAAFGADIFKNQDNISACLILYKEVVQVAIDYCDGSNDEKRNSMWTMIFTDMFNQLEIDTKGRLKKFIEQGLQAQELYNEMDRRITFRG